MILELITQLVKENIQFNFNNQEVTIYENYKVSGVHREVVTLVEQTYLLKITSRGKTEYRSFNSIQEVIDYAKQFSNI